MFLQHAFSYLELPFRLFEKPFDFLPNHDNRIDEINVHVQNGIITCEYYFI